MNIRTIALIIVALVSTSELGIGNSVAFSIEPEAKLDNKLILEAETQLRKKGYWITKVDKKWDASTYHAVVAFQKVEKLKRTGRLTAGLLRSLKSSSRPKASYSGPPHIEIDISRQVLFLVNENAKVTHILPVSTGNEKVYYQNGKKQIAHTPRGIFRITRQIKGIRRAPLGVLYHPNYFVGGVAIHGSGSIPFYPASHGCVRIPRFAASEFSDLVDVGMHVVVFDKAPKERRPIQRRGEKPVAVLGSLPCGIDKARLK